MGYKIFANMKREAMKTAVTFSVNLPYAVKKEGSVYVSWCPVLDVSSYGDTPEKARDMLIEAVKLFITSCYERGTLDRVLKTSGFVKAAVAAGKSKAAAPKKQISVPLPIDLNARLAQCLV